MRRSRPIFLSFTALVLCAGLPLATAQAAGRPSTAQVAAAVSPTVTTTVDHTELPTGSTLDVGAQAVGLGTATITSYHFYFGDGSTDDTSAPTATHVYSQTSANAANGTFAVQVTATLSDGSTVAGAPVAVRVQAPGPMTVPVSVQERGSTEPLTVNAEAYPDSPWGIASESLSFGDGSAPVDITNTPDLAHLHTYSTPGLHTVTVVTTDGSGQSLTTTQQFMLGSSLVPLTPTRILDTRAGLGAPKAKVGPGGTVSLQVGGVAGVPLQGVTSVIMNLTVADGTTGGYVTAYPSGTVRPTASNLNFAAGQIVANDVSVPVGPDGKVVLYNHTGSVDLIADIQGYQQAAASVPSGQFLAAGMPVPQRVLDTRSGVGAAAGKIGPGGTVSVQLPTGTSAVVLNLTVTDATAASYVSAYPSGTARPGVSNVDLSAGQTVANQVTVPVGANGQVTLYNHSGSVDLIADVQGYYGSPHPSAYQLTFTPTAPTRVLDTRIGLGTATGKLAAGRFIKLQVADPTATADIRKDVLINLTSVDATSAGFLTAYADGTTRPSASNLNLVVGGAAVPNLALVPIGADGCIDIYDSSGSVDVVADVEGYFVGPF